MNRRTLLQQSIAAGALFTFPFSELLANGQPSYATAENSATGKTGATGDTGATGGFKRFALGELELTVITDGLIKQTPVHPFVAPMAEAKAVKALLEANFRSTESMDLSMNVLVVKSKDKLILLDTGMGIFAEPTQGLLMTSLANAGFKPADFTDIIASHAHPDHIGGLITRENSLVFANADIHISKTEFNFWMGATVEDFKKSEFYKMKERLTQVIGAIRNVLNLIQPKVKYFDMEKGLYGIFSFQLAPGHTPGLTMITISSENERLVSIADLIHSDALLFAHPEWGFSGDTDLQLATASRKKVLKQLAATKSKTFAFHLPWPGLGHVRTKGNAFEWVPDVYATP